MRAVLAGAIERSVGDSLVARAASGAETAFAQIVAAHHDDMARVSFILCRDVQLAQDAASAAWLIAWRKLSTVPDPARLRPDPAERIALIDLANALARLDPGDRTVVALSAAGLSLTEIGQAIGMTSSGVRARLDDTQIAAVDWHPVPAP